MASDKQRLEQITKKIAESDKPKRHLREKTLENTIVELKDELSRLEKES